MIGFKNLEHVFVFSWKHVVSSSWVSKKWNIFCLVLCIIIFLNFLFCSIESIRTISRYIWDFVSYAALSKFQNKWPVHDIHNRTTSRIYQKAIFWIDFKAHHNPNEIVIMNRKFVNLWNYVEDKYFSTQNLWFKICILQRHKYFTNAQRCIVDTIQKNFSNFRIKWQLNWMKNSTFP